MISTHLEKEDVPSRSGEILCAVHEAWLNGDLKLMEGLEPTESTIAFNHTSLNGHQIVIAAVTFMGNPSLEKSLLDPRRNLKPGDWIESLDTWTGCIKYDANGNKRDCDEDIAPTEWKISEVSEDGVHAETVTGVHSFFGFDCDQWQSYHPAVQPRVNGNPFKCDCGCNVFTILNEGGKFFTLKCNSCGETYEGNRKP